MAPSIGEDFVGWKRPTGGDETLGLVGFSMFPHPDHEDLPENTMADAERWAPRHAGAAQGPRVPAVFFLPVDDPQPESGSLVEVGHLERAGDTT